MRGLDRLQGFDDAEFLDRFLDARAAPHAGGVDQCVAFAVAFKRHQYGVARGAGLIELHHAILAEQAIDQRALTHIRPADHGDLDALHLGPVGGVRLKPARAVSSSVITP